MKKIGVLMGGYSAESVISLQSGQTVFEHLSRKEFEPYRIHIFKDRWVLVDDKNREYSVNRHDFSIPLEEQTIRFDAVFNTIHGSPGEDGRLQAYFDLIGLPCTGCDFYASALTFNKKHCLQWASAVGIPTALAYFLHRSQVLNVQEILKKVGLPCFLKPNCSGSSLGGSKVSKETQLKSALEKAFKQDDEVIIEGFLEGTEVTAGIIPYGKSLKALPITELVSENDFFDYDAKYSGQSKEITPARLSKKMTLKIQEMAKRIHYLLKLRGLSRSEFIIVGETPYFLEINTTPGLAPASMMPQQVKAGGISLSELFRELLNEAVERKYSTL
nr:D-alanine--D-alanine ligase [Bacteroidetes bacterium endosymbiont of Geopemphigus sp.]